jgi:hypothetical protein
VISRHNEIRDELSDSASKAFISSAVRDEPKIFYSHPVEKKAALKQPNPSVPRTHPKTQCADRGDLLIRGLWAGGTDCIIDVRVTDTDANSNRSKDPAKVLAAHEREKRRSISRCGLHRSSSRQGSEKIAEEAICLTSCEVGEAVLPSVWLCQRSFEHCHRKSHSPLLTRLLHPHWSDEPPSTVGGQRMPQPFPPLRPAHVALALCFLAKTVQIHFAIFQSQMTRLPSRGLTPSTPPHLRSTYPRDRLLCVGYFFVLLEREAGIRAERVGVPVYQCPFGIIPLLDEPGLPRGAPSKYMWHVQCVLPCTPVTTKE